MKNIFCYSYYFIPLSVLLFLQGCSSLGTYNAATGRNEFVIISTATEVSMGEDIHADILKDNDLSSEGNENYRLENVGKRLLRVSDRQDYQYNFFVIDKDEMNAFTTPGGNIYIYTGLLNKLKTDDQLAAVIAHEIGHCSAKHVVKKFQAALGYNFIGSLILNQVDFQTSTRNILKSNSNLVMDLVFAAYSRKDEYQADRLGLKYMHLAGFDLNGMIEAFEILDSETESVHSPTMLRSHPYLSDRIDMVKKNIPEVEKGNAN